MKWNLEFFIYLIMRRRIWSVAILQWNLQKHYELYHCFICNTILLVIQWNITLNLLFIWFMRRRIWSMAILQWNLQKHYKLYHCYICNTILLVIQWNVTWDLLSMYLFDSREDLWPVHDIKKLIPGIHQFKVLINFLWSL